MTNLEDSETSDCDKEITGRRYSDDILCQKFDSEFSVLIDILNHKLQRSTNVHKISRDAMINHENDYGAIFGFNKALINSKFKLLLCFFQMNWKTFTILRIKPRIALSTKICLIGRNFEILR
jgi:hypothetical protein